MKSYFQGIAERLCLEKKVLSLGDGGDKGIIPRSRNVTEFVLCYC